MSRQPLTVSSHKGAYSVFFEETPFESLERFDISKTHFIVDSTVAKLYSKQLSRIAQGSCLTIDAKEENKSLEAMPTYMEFLMERGVRRGHSLVAIGGGIIQDITCFIAATLLRGISWSYYPTTLLSQADSCIGSKSSINVGKFKNIVGTFTPPQGVYLSTKVLDTLTITEIKSGIGEMIKVHVVAGPSHIDKLTSDYDSFLELGESMLRYIVASLEIKKAIIEADEFDTGIRNILNYGHSFGHAIESATDFGIPHGIAITIGMDMANFVACGLGRLTREKYLQLRICMRKNFKEFEDYPIEIEKVIDALGRDKKNGSGTFTFILLNDREIPEKVSLPMSLEISNIIRKYRRED